MENLTDLQISERLEASPDDLKETLSSGDATAIVAYIVIGQDLSEEQADLAALLTGRVLLGFLAPRDFISALAEELKIDYEIARAIGLEINEQIFLPVSDSLRKIHNLAAKPPSE